MIKLNKQFSIQLMKENNEGQPLNKLNDNIIQMLAKEYGGVTVSDVCGMWVDDETNKVFQDHSLMVSVSYSNGVNTEAFKQAIKNEFELGEQLAVIIRINNNTYILENKNEIDQINF